MIELVRQGKVDFPHMIVSVFFVLSKFYMKEGQPLKKATKNGIDLKK